VHRIRVAGLCLALVGAGLVAASTLQAHAATGCGRADLSPPCVFTAPGIAQFTVPAWVTTIHVNAVGGGTSGAHGADVVADVPVTPGARMWAGVGLYGGAPGRGPGGTGGQTGGFGGGSSDIRTCLNCGAFGSAQDPRRVVAGGGGGDGGDYGDGPSGGAGGPAGGGAPVATALGTCVPGSNGARGAPGVRQSGGGAGGGAATCTAGGAGGSGLGLSARGTDGAARTGGHGGDGTAAGGSGGGGGGGYYGGGGGTAGYAGGAGGAGGGGASFVTHAASGVSFATASSAAPRVTIAYRPGTPTNVNVDAAPGNGKVTVSWTPPDDRGGAATTLTSYTVTSDHGQTVTVPGNATSTIVTGLTNGTAYRFAVTATNPRGTSDPSALSSSVTPQPVVPSAPLGIAAVAGNKQATINWNAPATDGGSPITSYTVTSNPGAKTATVGGSARTATLTDLTNGTTYTFTVTATNGVGTGPASVPSSAVTPRSVPGAPTNVTATAGNTSATVSWTAPDDNGGAPVTSYVVTSSPDGKTATVGGSTTSATVTGLTNGTAYTFTVKALNDAGAGPSSLPSAAVTPNHTVPGAPSGVVATPGNKQATVSWTAPAEDGGNAITSYTVTSDPGGKTVTVDGSTTSADVTGLANGTAYTFTVKATNALGTSAASAPSNAVTPASLPGAPTNVVATGGNGEATVTWTPPADGGGSPITAYNVTSSPGGNTVTVTGTTATVTGLTNGTAYTFTVNATNGQGTGPDSAPSNAVTPGLFAQSFDSGMSGWTPGGLWHATSACGAGHGGGSGAYYGRDASCTYDDGTANIGTLMSPVIGGLPGSYTLNIWSRRRVESCSNCDRDRTMVIVDYKDGHGWQRVYYADARNPSSGAWEHLSIPLGSPTGKLQVQFRFQTTSETANGFYGWAVDDLSLSS